ncbi:hypothetical protein [Labilithrix luteola]|nr:hypothetical protein [Labilithrix luteola]
MTRSTTAIAAPFDLAWSAPEGCPSRDAIVDATYAQLGEPRSDAAPELLVTGSVAKRGGGFTVTLSMTDAAGAPVGGREVPVDRPRCEDIFESTVLVLAMMIAVARPREATLPARPADQSEVSALPAAVAPPQQPAEAHKPTRPARPKTPETPRPRVFVGAAAIASRGLLPSTGVGVGVSASYMPNPLLLLGLDASFEQAVGDVHAGEGDVAFRLFRGGMRVGVSILRTKHIQVFPLIGASLGLIQNTPHGYEAHHYPLRSTFLVGPGALARVRLGSALFLDLSGAVEVVLVRDRFNALVNGANGALVSVHRPSALAGRVGLGLGFDFR